MKLSYFHQALWSSQFRPRPRLPKQGSRPPPPWYQVRHSRTSIDIDAITACHKTRTQLHFVLSKPAHDLHGFSLSAYEYFTRELCHLATNCKCYFFFFSGFTLRNVPIIPKSPKINGFFLSLIFLWKWKEIFECWKRFWPAQRWLCHLERGHLICTKIRQPDDVGNRNFAQHSSWPAHLAHVKWETLCSFFRFLKNSGKWVAIPRSLIFSRNSKIYLFSWNWDRDAGKSYCIEFEFLLGISEKNTVKI